MKNLIIVAILSILVISCGGHKHDKNTFDKNPKLDSFIKKLNEENSSQSLAIKNKKSNIKWSSAKDNTRIGNFVVIGNGVAKKSGSKRSDYIAVDIGKWNEATNATNFLKNELNRGNAEYVEGKDPHWHDAYFTWFKGSHSGFEYSLASNTPKDLQKLGAIAEQRKNEFIGHFLAAEYGLSDSRSLELARVITSWDQIKSSRSMTKRDYNALTSEIFGLDYKEVKNLVDGKDSDLGDYKNLLEQAADHN